MNKLIEKEVNRLEGIIAEEERSLRLLHHTFDGFIHAEVDCRNMIISTQWIENDEVFAIPSEKIHGAKPIVLRGEVAHKIVMKAIDLLEGSIRFHKMQLRCAKNSM